MLFSSKYPYSFIHFTKYLFSTVFCPFLTSRCVFCFCVHSPPAGFTWNPDHRLQAVRLGDRVLRLHRQVRTRLSPELRPHWRRLQWRNQDGLGLPRRVCCDLVAVHCIPSHITTIFSFGPTPGSAYLPRGLTCSKDVARLQTSIGIFHWVVDDPVVVFLTFKDFWTSKSDHELPNRTPSSD